MSDSNGFRVPAWHAQHPGRSERYPLCGTVNLNGRVTHRVAQSITVTCKKCLSIQAKLSDAKMRCRQEWDGVNDPPCHPGDKHWRPCRLCDSKRAPERKGDAC